MARVYLDWNATTPPHPSVRAAMADAADDAWANAASVHGFGRAARAELDAAREALAGLVELDARDVVLTSGGTEANNLALAGLFDDRSGVLVTTAIEHPSIGRAAAALARRGVGVVVVAVGTDGVVDPARVADALAGGQVRLVSVQAVNHETGAIQPIAAIATLARAAGALLHVDAVQAAGKLDAETWGGADLVTIAAHKLRGPKGIGALAVRRGVRLSPLLFGGEQEKGLRPGTQDAVAAAGFAAACRHARGMPERYAALRALRDGLEQALIELGARLGLAVDVNGGAARVPHVTNLSFGGWRGAELCAALDLEGVAASSGAACSAGTAEPSAVITAILGRERAAGAVRLSLGEDTSASDVDTAIAAFARVLGRR